MKLVKDVAKELALPASIVAWAIWVTFSMFASQKADAVQETKYDTIISALKDIKDKLE